MLARLQRWATDRNILILLLMFIIFNAVVLPPVIDGFASMSHGAGLVDLLDSYTPDALYAHLASFEPAGRQLYILHELTLDVVYPLLSALMFSLIIAYLLKRAGPIPGALQYLALVPLVEMLDDFLENSSLVTILTSFPARLDALAAAANVFTVGKWILSYAELLALVVSLVVFLVQAARRLAGSRTASKGGSA